MIFTALGLSLGSSASLYLLGKLLLGLPTLVFFAIEISLVFLLFSISFEKIKRCFIKSELKLPCFDLRSVLQPKPQRILPFAFLIALIVNIFSFLLLSVREPHGGWDAWAIWNMRARFIFRSGEHWRNAFSSAMAWSHIDYPLLIPSLVTRSWAYVGDETTLVPATLAAVFTFSTLGFLVSSLSVLSGKKQGSIAGLLLLSSPVFIKFGASQCADIPLGFFILSTIVLLTYRDIYNYNSLRKNYTLTILAGFMTGFAASTKNEGMLFLVAVSTAQILLLPFANTKKEYRSQLKQVCLFLLGLLPLLGLLLYFKGNIAPSSEFLDSQNLKNVFSRISDFSRYIVIVKEFSKQLGYYVAILGACLLFLGFKLEKQKLAGITTALLTIFLMLLGYACVYLITPYDLSWHLVSSLDRLLIQLWPVSVFTCFLVIRIRHKEMNLTVSQSIESRPT
ncbi:hypothetical protein H6F90_01370 [Trichocoleus sp. FACHB-591]|uniref:hypothetical protein n=1 Tax=Trichocoleus sp. FACHB-591 TaxID=2692872 RepID=UPI001687209D|nr:hypothetical protein [Trichocoleus sp. FACHB-591]MBD2093803.1 hypothetical protein [Trichocoleus sp. FACHB-591]